MHQKSVYSQKPAPCFW